MPKDLAVRLDLDRAQLVNRSFVDPGLRQSHCDVLLRTPLVESGHDAYTYVIIEHQSRPDPDMPLRLLGYMVQIWLDHRRSHPRGRLPAIVPVVMHQGRRRWNAPTELLDLFDLDPDTAAAMQPWLPRFEFLLDDLTRVDEADLQARNLTVPALLTMLMLGAATDNSGILGSLVAWRAYFGQLFDWPGGDQIFEGLITYTFYKVNVTLDDLQRVFAPLDE